MIYTPGTPHIGNIVFNLLQFQRDLLFYVNDNDVDDDGDDEDKCVYVSDQNYTMEEKKTKNLRGSCEIIKRPFFVSWCKASCRLQYQMVKPVY